MRFELTNEKPNNKIVKSNFGHWSALTKTEPKPELLANETTQSISNRSENHTKTKIIS